MPFCFASALKTGVGVTIRDARAIARRAKTTLTLYSRQHSYGLQMRLPMLFECKSGTIILSAKIIRVRLHFLVSKR